MRLIAHRGLSGLHPENTMSSFRAALRAGAAAVEFDVQQSSDGVLVVVHDPVLSRLCGLRRKVGDLPARRLSSLDAGRWFSSRFAGERIPRLEEVMGLLGGRVEVHLEIKQPPDDAYEGIEGRVCALLSSRPDWMKRTVVSSFDHEALVRVRALRPEVRLGLLAGPQAREDALRRASGLGCESVHLGRRQADRDWVRRAHCRGLRVLVYTVNERREFERLRALGADGVFTDRLDALKERP